MSTHKYLYYASVMDVLGKISYVIVRNNNSFCQGTPISIEKTTDNISFQALLFLGQFLENE